MSELKLSVIERAKMILSDPNTGLTDSDSQVLGELVNITDELVCSSKRLIRDIGKMQTTARLESAKSFRNLKKVVG